MTERVFHPGLEGLRGVSVLAVLFFHASTAWLPGGFLGVSTFFTLSGFLITGLLVREWEASGRIRLGAFWARRLRRLLPASLVALLGIAIIAPTFSDGTQAERLAGDGLAALFYVSNWWLIITGAAYDDLMGSPSWVQHFWSLSVEEQYYFVYPLFTLAVLRVASGSRLVFGATLGTLTLVSWAWMSGLVSEDVTTARIYYGTDTRAGELLAGGVLALVLSGRSALPNGTTRTAVVVGGIVGLAVTGYGWAVATVESESLYRGGIATYALATLAVIAAAVQSGGPVRTLLSLAPLRWIGRISYGAYVYHWPIFLTVENDVVRFALTLALADLSYRFLEEPIRAGRRVVAWRRFVVPPAAIALAAATLMMTATTPELPLVPTEYAPAPAALGRKLRILVVGDSLGRDLGEGLAMWAERGGAAEIENIAIRGCGMARGAWSESRRRTRSNCDTWPRRAKKRLKEFQPDVVVASTAGWDLIEREKPEWGETKIIGDPQFDAWIVEEYGAISDFFIRSGARVVWMNIPCRQSPMGVKKKSWDPERSRRMNDYVLPTVAAPRAEHVTVIDFESAICPGGEFAKSVHGIEGFRRDGTHLSAAGKLWVGTWLGERLVAEASAGPTTR